MAIMNDLKDLLENILKMGLFKGPEDVKPYDTYKKMASSDVKPKVTVALSLALGLLCILLFSFLRRRLPYVYDSRARFFKVSPATRSTSFFGWIWPIFQTPESHIFKFVGLDAFMILRFFRMSALLFLICASYGSIFNLHISFSTIADKGTGEKDKTVLELWYILIGTHLFSILSFYFFQREFKVYRQLRWNSLKAKGSQLSSRTVRILHIPQTLQGPALEAHINGLNIGQVESVNFCYTTETLEKLIKLRNAALFKVEKFVHSWLKGSRHACNVDTIRHSIERGTLLQIEGTTRPTSRLGWLGIFGTKVDAISYHYNLYLSYANEVEKIRNSFDTLKTTSSAFVSFQSFQSSNFLSQILVYSEPPNFDVDLAPEPLNIYWKNLNITWMSLISRGIFAYLILIFVLFYGVLGVWYISTTLKFSLLSSTFFGFLLGKTENEQTEGKKNNNSWSIKEDLLQTLVTSIFYSVTPLIFTGVSVLQGLRTHSSIEKRTISFHFLFLVANILVVLTFVESFWDNFLRTLNSMNVEVLGSFSQAMAGNLAFFVRYFILLGVGCLPIQLLHPGPLFYHLFAWVLRSSPRGIYNFNAPVYMDYGWLFGTPMFVFVVVSIYSAVSPKILIVGVAYFVVGYFVIKNNLLYVYTRHYESNGLLWPFVYRHILMGVFLLQIFSGGIFVNQNKIGFLLGLAPLLSLSILYCLHLNRKFPKDCRYLPADWFLEENYQPTHSFRRPSGGHGIRGKLVSFLKDLFLAPDLNTPIFSAPDPSVSEPNLSDHHPQAPCSVLKGILDSSITSYKNPYIYGELPRLWLPPNSPRSSPYHGHIASCSCCLPDSTLINPSAECDLSLGPDSNSSSSTASLEA